MSYVALALDVLRAKRELSEERELKDAAVDAAVTGDECELSEECEQRDAAADLSALHSLNSPSHFLKQADESAELARLMAAAERAVLSRDALADPAELMLHGEPLP